MPNVAGKNIKKSQRRCHRSRHRFLLLDVTVDQIGIANNPSVRDDVNVAFVDTFIVAPDFILRLGMQNGKDAERRLVRMEQSRWQAKEDANRQNDGEKRRVYLGPKEF